MRIRLARTRAYDLATRTDDVLSSRTPWDSQRTRGTASRRRNADFLFYAEAAFIERVLLR